MLKVLICIYITLLHVRFTRYVSSLSLTVYDVSNEPRTSSCLIALVIESLYTSPTASEYSNAIKFANFTSERRVQLHNSEKRVAKKSI